MYPGIRTYSIYSSVRVPCARAGRSPRGSAAVAVAAGRLHSGFSVTRAQPPALADRRLNVAGAEASVCQAFSYGSCSGLIQGAVPQYIDGDLMRV